jgi:hypothetical protein
MRPAKRSAMREIAIGDHHGRLRTSDLPQKRNGHPQREHDEVRTVRVPRTRQNGVPMVRQKVLWARKPNLHDNRNRPQNVRKLETKSRRPLQPHLRPRPTLGHNKYTAKPGKQKSVNALHDEASDALEKRTGNAQGDPMSDTSELICCKHVLNHHSGGTAKCGLYACHEQEGTVYRWYADEINPAVTPPSEKGKIDLDISAKSKRQAMALFNRFYGKGNPGGWEILKSPRRRPDIIETPR